MTDRNIKPDSGTDLVFEDAGSTDRIRIIDGGSTILYEDHGAAALTVETPGDVTIETGSLMIGSAGRGIDFSNQAAPAPGATSELLDSYEEGIYTPTVSSMTTTGSPAYTGNYTKIGNLVQVTIYSTAAGATYTVVGGSTTFTLPFPAEAANGAFQSGGVGVFANGNTTDGGILAVNPGGSTVYFFESMASTANISASVSYRVA